MKSMNRQLGRVDFTEETDPKATTPEPEPAGPAGSGGKTSPAKG